MSRDKQSYEMLQSRCSCLTEEMHIVFLGDSGGRECPISGKTYRKLFGKGDLVIQMASGLARRQSHIEKRRAWSFVPRDFIDSRDAKQYN